jgi:hypothetical protein
VEVRQPFLNKQLELYFRAASVVGRFATLKPSTDKWADNEDAFLQLYWSELSVVESREVESAMVEVKKAIERYKAAPNDDQALKGLDGCIYELAHSIRRGIKRGWRGL